MKITVTHIGEDYGKVETQAAANEAPVEYEVPRGLAEALHKYLNIEEKRQSINVAVKKLFSELCEILGHADTIQYTPGRANKLRLRLKRYTPDQIKDAAKGIAADDFLQGDNPGGRKYGNIDYLLRNDEMIDKWLPETTGGGPADLRDLKI